MNFDHLSFLSPIKIKHLPLLINSRLQVFNKAKLLQRSSSTSWRINKHQACLPIHPPSKLQSPRDTTHGLNMIKIKHLRSFGQLFFTNCQHDKKFKLQLVDSRSSACNSCIKSTLEIKFEEILLNNTHAQRLYVNLKIIKIIFLYARH